jgi:hypothetical protein
MKDKLPSVNDEPAGTYQVWHRHGEAHRHVANVEAGNYMAAVVLPLVERGAPGSERVTWLVDSARPTTYGDKIVDPLGAAYEIYKPGFGGAALRETSMPEAVPLASREANRSGDQPRHPWPSEVANSNKHKQPSTDHGEGSGREHSHGKDDGYSM